MNLQKFYSGQSLFVTIAQKSRTSAVSLYRSPALIRLSHPGILAFPVCRDVFLTYLLSISFITHIYSSCPLSVLHDLHIRKALDILLELGETIIPYLEVPEPGADPVAQGTEGDPVSSVRLDLPEDIFLHHLLPALILVERD